MILTESSHLVGFHIEGPDYLVAQSHIFLFEAISEIFDLGQRTLQLLLMQNALSDVSPRAEDLDNPTVFVTVDLQMVG